MDFGKVLANPIVWGGGAAIGLILLMRAPSSVPNAQASTGLSPAIISGTVAMNSAALGAQIELAGIDANLAKARFSRDAVMQSQILGYLNSVNDNATMVAINGQNTRAGITQNIIQSSTLLQLDIQQNANRLALGAQETDRTAINADKDIKVERYRYKAAKSAAISNAIGSIAGSASKIATGL